LPLNSSRLVTIIKVALLEAAAVQIPPPALFIRLLTLSVASAAAMTCSVMGRLSIFFRLRFSFAKVVEIDDLGHAFAPSVIARQFTAVQMSSTRQTLRQTIFHRHPA